MRKRVLVVEAADAIRGVVETVLRQNGLEVISVASADKADEVLDFSRPDLLVVGADLQASDDTPYFQKVQRNSRASSVPMLLFAPTDGSTPDFPDEGIIPQPFDPQEFLQKVTEYLGQGQAAVAPGNNATIDDGDDEFLDAALGLDSLDVEESEELNRTKVTRKSKKRVGKAADMSETDPGKPSKVESLIITDDETDIKHAAGRKRGTKATSESSKLEIMSDQYGMVDPMALKPEGDKDASHDYDWFVNSMRDEAAGIKTPAEGSGDHAGEADELEFSKTSTFVDPVTPSPASASSPPPASKDKGKDKSGSVEKFLDEFKKEMEVLRSEEPESVVVNENASAADGQGEMKWEDKVEKMSAREVSLFTRELTRELADRLAEIIAAKIDSEKLLQLIKREVLNRTKR
jgi:DNA-binding response OmpR family regulator